MTSLPLSPPPAPPLPRASSISSRFDLLLKLGLYRSEPRPSLSADDVSRLLAALRRRSLHGLNKLDHEHLAVLVQTVFEVSKHA